VLAQALTAATAVRDNRDRASALTGLAPYLPAEEQPAVLAQALTAATTDPSDYRCAWTLIQLAPQLPAYLQPAALDRALTAATAIPFDSDRAKALAVLASQLPADRQPAVLARALAAAAVREDSFGGEERAQTLTELAPHLAADLLSQALELTPKWNIETMRALLQRCRSLFPRDEDVAYVDLLRKTTNGIDRGVCFDLISAVAPTVAEIGGVRAVEECIHAVIDVHRWWP